jgi:hypothetical protein
MNVPPEIFSCSGQVVLFPVRHHSPTAAIMVWQLIREIKPTAVLIEGPFDFNDRMDELSLAHELPIAIYSYVRLADDRRRGAYYPFCIYSPEWQAMIAARECGATARFIDLPFASIAAEDDRTNRYSDTNFERGKYISQLCQRLGVDTFSAVWDTMFELDQQITPQEYLRRMHLFCGQMRLVDETPNEVDRQREAFMASQIRQAMQSSNGRIVVVTGGYHSLALHARLNGNSSESSLVEPLEYEMTPLVAGEERGIAITPYSYERLDSLRGYDAGMPNPGFYHRLWHDRQSNRPIAHRKLMFDVARRLRDYKQRVSSADLIAAESCATALAHIRGHGEVWRTDLVDGLIGALIKDELASGGSHPLLEAIHDVLRGNARGRLAEGSALPPLVHDLKTLLTAHGLTPEIKPRDVDLDLLDATQRNQSRLLHRLRILAIRGFNRTNGTDFSARKDLARLWERWSVQWSPEFDSSAIEAARYGPTLAEAAANRLAEQGKSVERSANKGALLLVDASLADLNSLAAALHAQLVVIVREDGEILSVTAALGHLLYLYKFDESMGTQGRADVGAILREAFSRGLWLLEILGQMIDPDGQTVNGVLSLLDTFERCEHALSLNRLEFTDVLSRVSSDRSQGPSLRGAAIGALWVLGNADAQRVRTELRLFSDPDHLGDFLTGLFAVARELVQRDQDLILAIDDALGIFSADDFLTALPSLRLAFTFFTPREKHHMASSLLEALGINEHEKQRAALEVLPQDAARALALESRLFTALAKYGLRGNDPS